MPINDLNLKDLQRRINELKTENTEAIEFTKTFLNCLLKRHHLANSIPMNFEIEGVSNEILNDLRLNNLPSNETFESLSIDEQNILCFECLWCCGMQTVIQNSDTEESENTSVFDTIVEMRDLGISFYIGSYMIAALSLLTGQIPSQNLILNLTNEFKADEESIQNSMNLFLEFASAILSRYEEDLAHY